MIEHQMIVFIYCLFPNATLAKSKHRKQVKVLIHILEGG